MHLTVEINLVALAKGNVVCHINEAASEVQVRTEYLMLSEMNKRVGNREQRDLRDKSWDMRNEN